MNALRSEGTEKLLRREARACLPLPLQMRLYLDPGALFKDAARGPLLARQQARRYNVRYRWMLLPYVRRWMAIALLFFACIAPAEALGATRPAFTLLAATLALGSCVAMTVSAQILIAYLLLGAAEARGRRRPWS